MKRHLPVAIAATTLAACAGDNPDNVPLYGEWEMATRVDSLSIDGMQVPREHFPPEFLALETTEKLCGEPMFADKDWQERDITRKVRTQCTLSQYDVTPRLVTGKGQCESDGSPADFSPGIDVRINQAPDQYKLVVTLGGSANVQGLSGRHVVRATAVQRGRRLGDC